MATKFGIIGTGWSFPTAFRKSSNTVDMLTEEADINSSLQILLSTATGERIMQYGFGCDLKEFMFEPLTTTLKTFMADKIKKAILYHEPRIIADAVTIEQPIDGEGKIFIQVQYTVRTTNSRYNYVYDYYIAEGAEVKNR